MVYLLMLLTFVPVVFISAFIPYVTRRTESFGIAIPEEAYDSDELKTMRKKYAWQTAVFGAAVMAVWLIYAMLTVVGGAAYVVALFVFIVGSFLIYLVYHNRMIAVKDREKWYEKKPETVVVDTGFRNRKVALALGWYAVPLGVALATLVLTYVFYGYMPDKIPVHSDLSGHVNRWATKSYRTVLSLPLLQLYITALFIFINIRITKSKQQLDVSNPKKSAQQNQVFRQRWSWFLFITGTLIVLMFAFMQLSFFIHVSSVLQTVVPLVVAAVVVIGSIVLAFSTGQGGSRVRTGKSKSGETINRDDDQYWKLGQFYFNPNDPAIWVEKRFGIGWTVNFAHPAGWGALIVIILIAVLIPILTQ